MNYKEIIESKYNREAWQQLLHDIFLNNVSFWRSPKEVKANSRLAKSALNLGKISLSDGEALAIYEVELSDKVDIERNRAGIRDMLTKDWRDMGYAGAFCSAIERMKVSCASLTSARRGNLIEMGYTKNYPLTPNVIHIFLVRDVDAVQQ